ncbi:unnamed protein product [Dimorphilus gyrociliatus]|uniref:RING-type domain-containing protein n=1 Tax=Dimorphilus gyrociliatus TaxID=2664684 RepID=A0A7I8VDZ2_9ANNE|nr:unnamed protein product [Dimorphilus gyrociliatus]
MNKDDNTCPICKEDLITKKPKRLPCNLSHVFCRDCLINLEKYLQLKTGDKFPCPICKTYSKWPRGGVDSFSDIVIFDNTNQIENVEDIYVERIQQENFADEFKRILLTEINNSEELKRSELNKLDNKINILKASINKKQAILKDELEIFYSQKQSKLREMMRECEFLKQIPPLSGGRISCIFREKYDSIKEELTELREKIVKTDAILVTPNEDVQIGSVVFSHSDQSRDKREIFVEGYLSKIRSFNGAIFAFSSTKDTISWTNIETGENMSWSMKQNSGFLDQEICLGGDGLIYLYHGTNFESSRIFTIDSHFKEARKEKKVKAYVRLTDPQYITFSNVLFFMTDSLFIMYDKAQKLLANMDLKKSIIDLKVIKNKVFFLLSNGKIKKVENGSLIDLKITKIDGNFSIIDDIIPKLRDDDKFLLFDDSFIYMVTENSKKTTAYCQKHLFTNDRIKGYKIGINKVIFAVVSNRIKDKITMKYFDF